MSGLLAIVRRELRSQLASPVVWIVLTLYLLVAGWFFFNLVSQFSVLVANSTVYAQMTSNPALLDALNLNEIVVGGLFSNLLVLFLFFVPALTMRSFAEERRQGTDELLLTAPVSPGVIVAAKFLGVLAVTGTMVATTGIFVAILLRHGNPEPGPIATGLLGLFLAVAALTALGIAVSTLTESQVMAAVGSFVLFLALYVVAWPAEAAEGRVRAMLEGLSFPAHFGSFARGLVASPDAFYFLSLAALGLFVARVAIASQRWR
jgi:ABC-2 type transport system permease protein